MANTRQRNYSEGKIYKIEPICEHDEGDIYIGSTTKQYLSQRMSKHKSGYKCWLSGKINKNTVYSLFDKYGVENCKIILVELVNVNSNDELLKREAYHIKSLKCVNKIIPLRTKKEYNNDNKESIAEYIKSYNSDNKESIAEHKKKYRETNIKSISEKAKQQITCNCGITFTKHNKARHERSNKHQKYITSQSKQDVTL